MTSDLEKRIGYEFNDKLLLRTALTHSSKANEDRGSIECNERLEFLGDSILGFIVAEYIYMNNPGMPEGKMTRLRAELVCEKNLVTVARSLDIGSALLLGRGEEHTGGRTRTSILADAVESIIAAIYLDGGLEMASRFIYKHVLEKLESGEFKPQNTDSKTYLQEIVQRTSGQLLEYNVTGSTGPEHERIFTVEVLLNGKHIADGTGRTKKAAEQDAAKHALLILK